MLELFCNITGDDYGIVKNETPSSKRKISLMATALFVPVILWLVSSFMLVHVVMQKHWLAALVSAVFVGVVIFIIERSIIMSNGSKWITGFRVILGLLVATLGSVVIDEVVFKGDIDTRLAENKDTYVTQKVKEFELTLESDRQFLVNDMKEKNQTMNDLVDQTIAEASGDQPGTGYRGVGEVAIFNNTLAEKSRVEYQEAKSKLEEFDAEQNRQIEDKRTYYERSYNEHSLLLRIKAMFDLVFSDLFMGLIYLLFTLILFFLEFLVVIIKMCIPKTSYEHKLELQEKISINKMNKLFNKHEEMYDTEAHLPSSRRERIKLNGVKAGIY